MMNEQRLLELGLIKEERGDYQAAERFYRTAWFLAESKFGEDGRALAPYLYNLAFVLWAVENYHEARAYFRRLHRILIREFGSDHKDALEIRDLLAELDDELAALPVNLTAYAS